MNSTTTNEWEKRLERVAAAAHGLFNQAAYHLYRANDGVTNAAAMVNNVRRAHTAKTKALARWSTLGDRYVNEACRNLS